MSAIQNYEIIQICRQKHWDGTEIIRKYKVGYKNAVSAKQAIARYRFTTGDYIGEYLAEEVEV